MTRKEIGKLIREMRVIQGMSKQALAESCGYNGPKAYNIVYLWETGARAVPDTRKRRLAAALQIPVEKLIP